MPKYYHPKVLDNGLQHVIDMAGGNVDIALIKTYSQGQAYVTVASNVIGQVDLLVSDLALSDEGTGRKLTIAQKSGTVTAIAAAPDLHVALLDVTNAEVLAVTDELADEDKAIGDPFTIPTFYMAMTQPV